MSTYLTDSWSTISGLASVAYGSPDRYPEVANRVRIGSPVAFLGNTPPSLIIEPWLEQLENSLQEQYDLEGDFAEFVDSGHKDLPTLASELRHRLLKAASESGTYESSLSGLLEYAAAELPLDAKAVATSMLERTADLGLYVRLASFIPYPKLDKLPAGERIELDDRAQLESDYRGVGFPTGYLTPGDYFNGIAYPGMVDQELPDSIIKTLTEGYLGYPTLQPLEDVFNPGYASALSLDDIQDLRNVSRVVAGLGTLNTLKDLTSVGRMSRSDQAMYSVDLAEIIIERNGYTVFDPNNSNGDLISQALLPDYDSQNADSGLPYSARSRSNAF